MNDHREGTLAVQARLVVVAAPEERPAADVLAVAKEAPGRPCWTPREEARWRPLAVLVVVRSEAVPQALSAEEAQLLAGAGHMVSVEVVVVARTVLVGELEPGMG